MGLASAVPVCAADLREPVHPRRNVEVFAPVQARFVRFTVRTTNRGEPCLDELEIYSSGPQTRNVALAANGARATASGSLPGFAIHQLEGLNDGRYGNGRSWIADRIEAAWVQIELPEVIPIARIVWGRDREGNFIDRLATRYQIHVAVNTNEWKLVASSEDREPLPLGAQLGASGSITRPLVNRFAPVSTALPGESGLAPSDYRIDVWQTADGLPGNTVTAIQQTPDGYLWVGTLNGLVRFDGVRFRVFGESSDLPTTRVLSLLAARNGALWIGTDGGGLVRCQDGRFETFGPREGAAAGETVTALAEDGAGRIWVGTSSGLKCWQNGRFIEDRAVRSQRGVPVTGVTAAGDALWVVAERRLLTRTADADLGQPHATDPSSFSSVLTAELGRSGLLWFGGPNGYIGAVSNTTVHVFREQPGQLLETVWTLCETRNGDVWAGTANGGLRRLRHGMFTSLTTVEGLSDNSVRCLFEDQEGSLWVGTVGGGLNRVKPRRLTTYTTRDGLAHNVVMSLAEDADGTLWIGSNCGGLSVRRDGIFSPMYTSYLLDNECIWSLLPGPDASLWVGTWGGGLYRVQGREVANFSIARGGDDDPVIALSDDGAGGLWVGTMRGLKRFRDRNVIADLRTNGLPAVPITSMIPESAGLWIGTGGAGVFHFDGHTPTGFGRSNGLPGNWVRTLFRDRTGILWIGTGSGLARMQNRRLTAFGRAQGLPDEVISQILEDDAANLWLGSNQGIFRVARRELDAVAEGRATRVNPIAYGRAEGLESLECTGGFHPSGLRSRDGRLWFSTVKGLVAVDPANISINERPPPVVIEQVLVDGVRLSARANQPLMLGPGGPRVEIHYAALSLVAPERNRFKYRLDGLETVWVEAGAQRVAAYPGLSPGRYEFRVLACNNDGIWNEQGASLRFVVQPRLWQTWWFRTLTAFGLLGAVAWGVRTTALQRFRRKLARLQQRHAVEQERMRIARDIHDELGANLTRIALLSEVGQKHCERPAEVAADLTRISATAREAVRAMDAIVWAVNPRNDSLDHFANYVSQYAEEFLRLTSIRCRLDIPADLPEHPLSTEARHHLFLAVKEALNNVVRHSGASEVWLRLKMDPGELIIVVADNGQGMQPLPAGISGHDHDGLRNIRQRVEAIGGRLDLNSDSAGTILRLCLPLPTEGRVRRR
jgi:ligand-binding sensor domain-containing protein/signal transduction histidine kinase